MVEAAATLAAAVRRTPAMDWEGFFRNYRVPDFIPGYTVLNKLGGGVFGEVFKARKSSIGKLYAIKFLRLQDESLTEQVLRELQAITHFAQVDHPNLVSIEDRGEVGGIPYIVMGYAGDETLKVLLREGAVALDRALFLFRQMLRGVKALHEHGIIHFDLKPANVFIKGDVARIGDYGLSKLMSESRATLSMGRGTPYYMAPEMLRRKGDARSDVYSLGVILYEMLTGEVPFRGDTEWEILKRHETEQVAVPSRIPLPLAALVVRALSKDPESRYRHAGAMLEAYEAAVRAMQPVAAAAEVPLPEAAAAASVDPAGDEAAPRSRWSCSPFVRRNGGRFACSPFPRQVGEAAGRLAARGQASVERVHAGLREVLDILRSRTRESVDVAVRTYRAEKAVAGRRPAAPAAEGEVRRRRGPIGALFHAIAWIVLLPCRVVAWTLRHPLRWIGIGARRLLQAAIVLGVCAGLAALVHLGLRELIL